MRSGQYWSELIPRGFVKLEDEPEELGPLDFYLDAFRELSTCRSSGMGLGPIPFTAIVEYSRLYDVGDFDDFNYIIRLVDNAYLELNDKKNKGGESNGSTKAGKADNRKGRRRGN